MVFSNDWRHLSFWIASIVLATISIFIFPPYLYKAQVFFAGYKYGPAIELGILTIIFVLIQLVIYGWRQKGSTAGVSSISSSDY